MEKSEALERFVREKPYWRLLRLGSMLEDEIRPSDSRKRADALQEIASSIRAVANELYLARGGLLELGRSLTSEEAPDVRQNGGIV
jgi:hypothetical protein